MATYTPLLSSEVKEALGKVGGEVKRVTVKKVTGTLYVPQKKYCKFGENNMGRFLRFGVKSPDGEYLNITVFNYEDWYFGKVVPVFFEIYIKGDKTGRPHLAAKAVRVKKREGMRKIRIISDLEKIKGKEVESHFLLNKGKKSPVIVIE